MVLAQKLVVLGQLLRGIGIVRRQLRLQLILDLLHQRVALDLRVLLGVESVLQPVADLRLQRVVVLVVDLERVTMPLRLPRAANQLFDARADLLDLAVRELDRIDNDLFASSPSRRTRSSRCRLSCRRP